MAAEIAPFGFAPMEVDPLTGAPIPSQQAQRRFNAVANAPVTLVRKLGGHGVEVDPMTGLPFENAAGAQGKFNRIADAVVGGLKHWVETPGRKLWGAPVAPDVPGQVSEADVFREDQDARDSVDWGAGTAFGMLGVGTPAGMFGPAGAAGASGGRLVRSRALPMDESSRMARAAEQGYEGPWYHGSWRMDRFTEKGKVDPKRATSGPMPYFTDSPEMASGYAMGKKGDTSLLDEGRVGDYFTVSPKELGIGGRTEFPVERSWHFLPPEVKATIAERAKRIGYENPNEASGPLTLHPPGVDASLSSSHYDWLLKNEEKGNHLAALRNIWHDGGNLVGNETELARIYQLAGYPHRISEKNAPWTEARGVFPAMLRMRNPLITENEALMTRNVLPGLEEAFKRDRTRLQPYGADMWDKNTRFTPRDWVANAREDYLKGDNSFVWTSIPDKVTAQLRGMGYDSIIDTGGKMGGQSHKVAIPFSEDQVRSRFARFDPENEGKGFVLGAGSRDAKQTAAGTVAQASRDQGFGSLAPLPMDEASRMGRAAEQGYTLDAYHGTTSPGFDKIEARQPALGAKGVYAATDPSHANAFARDYIDGTGGVYPLKVREPIAPRSRYLELSGRGMEPNEIAAQLKSEGFRGFYEDAQHSGFVTFDPADVRGRFAKFDPANEGKGMILGSGSRDPAATAAGTVAQATRGERGGFGSLSPVPELDWSLAKSAETGLSRDASRALDTWVGGPHDALDLGMEFGLFHRPSATKALNDPAIRAEIDAKMKPVRDALREKHGDTVTLFRHSGEVPEGATPHEYLSMTSDPRVAEQVSGAPRQRNVFTDAEIAAKEAEFAKGGEVKIGPITLRNEEIGKHPKTGEPVMSVGIFDPRVGGFVTDTPSVAEYMRGVNADRAEVNATRETRLKGVREHKVPVDDIVAATDRFGQKEFIVRNRSGTFYSGSNDAKGAAAGQVAQATRDAPLSTSPGALPADRGFSAAKTRAAALDAEVAAASDAIKAFTADIPRGPMGLLPDAVKFSPEYRAIKGAYDRAFAKSRDFYGQYNKAFEKELKAERAEKRAARESGTTLRSGTDDVKQALGGQVAQSTRDAPLSMSPGIRAYHGSPHDFDRFDLSKIGTGEGAQAYGHGLYFAENEGVARGYRDALTKKPADALGGYVTFNARYGRPQGEGRTTAGYLRSQGFPDDPEMVRLVDRAITGASKGHGAEVTYSTDALAAFREIEKIMDKPGRMYEVNLKAKPEQFLDWDKPLGQQSEFVKDSFKPERLGLKAAGPLGDRGWFGWTDAQNRLIGRAQTKDVPTELFDPREIAQTVYRGGGTWKPPEASEILREAGIPGIRYLDQGSRRVGAGTGVDDLIAGVMDSAGGDRGRALREIEGRIVSAREMAPKHQSKEGLSRLEEAHALLSGKWNDPRSRNFVVFDPGIIDIMRKYALPGAVGGGAAFGSLAPGDGS